VGYPHLYGLAVGEQQPVIKKLVAGVPPTLTLAHLCLANSWGVGFRRFQSLTDIFGPAANGYLV